MRYKSIAGKYPVSVVGIGGHYSTYDAGPDDPQTYGSFYPEEVRTRRKLLRRAMDAGINYFDSTWRNEADMLFAALGDLVPSVRETVFISGMVLGTFNLRDREVFPFAADYVKDGLEYRLRRVPGGYLDNLHIQTPERNYSEAEADEVMAYLDDRKKKGDIRCIGISTHEPAFARTFADRYDLDLIMAVYNFHHREVDTCFDDYRGPAVFVAMKPLIWQLRTYGIPLPTANLIPDFPKEEQREDIAVHSIAWNALSPRVATTVCSVNSERDLDDLIRAGDEIHPDSETLSRYTSQLSRDNGILFALSSLKCETFNDRNYFHAIRNSAILLGLEFPFVTAAPYEKLPFAIEDVKTYFRDVVRPEAVKQGYGKYVE